MVRIAQFDDVLDVKCPWCGAARGKVCVKMTGKVGTPAVFQHVERRRAAMGAPAWRVHLRTAK